MSLSALTIAVTSRIQDALNITGKICDVMPDERPPPRCGMEFISVYGRSWSPGIVSPDVGLDEMYDVDCALTFRIGKFPTARRAETVYLNAFRTMESRLREIVLAVHMQTKILTEANKEIPTGQSQIVEMLRWLGSDAGPKPVGPDHFHSSVEIDPQTASATQIETGFMMVARFGQARRLTRVVQAT